MDFMIQEKTIHCYDCPIYKDSILHTIPYKEIERINSIKTTITYEKGEHIFSAGDRSEFFHCMMKGSVQLFRKNQSSREQSFAIIGPGASIGYRDALAGIPYQHNARCLNQTSACQIPSDILHDIINIYPAFTNSIIKEISNGWIESERQSYNLGARKTVERLADFLLGLKSDYDGRIAMAEESDKSEDQRDGRDEVVEIDFPLTRETVATLIGTTTESVIRTLSDFKARGWIEFHNGKIRIINDKELVRLVDES